MHHGSFKDKRFRGGTQLHGGRYRKVARPEA